MPQQAHVDTRPAFSNDPQTVVEAFLAAFEAQDLPRALDFVAEDCVYKNVPFHTARGKQRISRDLGLLAKGMNSFKVDMIHIAVNGNVVMTERVDTLGTRLASAAVPIMGCFVVENGKITQWRDYFDWSVGFGRLAKSLALKPFKLNA